MSDLHPALHPIKFQRTFCMVKPDGVMRGLIGDIIYRIEKSGLKIIAMKMLLPTESQIRQHLPVSDEVWVHRLGGKSLSGFEGLDVTAKEVLGTDDQTTIGKEVAESLVAYMMSAPVVCMVVEGIQAIDMVRKLAGHTLPYKADVGTIRGDYSVDSPSIANAEKRAIHNLFHASENISEAQNEMSLWFTEEEIQSYARAGEDVMYSKHY
ncbi:MAG TPA: nucleoside-diphosphate kinase [Patescibacteria group bacterium]|jgi:nucleoside-diphosphate kinase|nr:nucleoside-diphosphate kinase [Patescibacteria group bacterium]